MGSIPTARHKTHNNVAEQIGGGAIPQDSVRVPFHWILVGKLGRNITRLEAVKPNELLHKLGAHTVAQGQARQKADDPTGVLHRTAGMPGKG